MESNILKREHPNKKSRLVGRGGTRGKTSGRGGKGQTARAGNKRRPEMRDIIKKLPKLRGYHFKSTSIKFSPVNVGALNVFKSGEEVTPVALIEKRLIRNVGGNTPRVKILGGGDLTVKLSISGCVVSKSAQVKIEKVGGTVK